MNHRVESLLEDDHASLDQLFAELDLALAKPDIARGFELLDLFWARLAVHIRAEHLMFFDLFSLQRSEMFIATSARQKISLRQERNLAVRSSRDTRERLRSYGALTS